MISLGFVLSGDGSLVCFISSSSLPHSWWSPVPVWVFCLFGCSACLGVLLFGCYAWCLIRSIYNSLEVFDASFFFPLMIGYYFFHKKKNKIVYDTFLVTCVMCVK